MRWLTLLFLFSLFLNSYTVIDNTEEAKKKREENSVSKDGKVIFKPIKKKIIQPIEIRILQPTPKKIIYPIGQKPKDINSSKKEKKSAFTPIEELNNSDRTLLESNSSFKGLQETNRNKEIKPVSLEE